MSLWDAGNKLINSARAFQQAYYWHYTTAGAELAAKEVTNDTNALFMVRSCRASTSCLIPGCRIPPVLVL
jgi:hypothetical protein